jgi:hypothetical protein
MRRTGIVVAVAGAALAAVIAGTTALAGTSGTTPAPTPSQTCPAGCTGTGQGWGPGMGSGMGPGMGPGGGAGRQQGWGPGNGIGGQGQAGGQCCAALPASGTLSAEQKTQLASLAEEEKLAHDVYIALAASSGDQRFTRIAAAETRHLSALRTLMARYQVSDPTAGKAEGAFASSRWAEQYRTLVARGKVSLAAALEVGRSIERADIADLQAADKAVTAADVSRVYSSLAAASGNHLRAFGG